MSRRYCGSYQACAVLDWNLAQQHPVVVNASVNSLSFPKNFGKRSWSKHLTIRVNKIKHGLHRRFVCRWDIPGWWNRIHSLMLVRWQKEFHAVTFYAIQLWAWSPHQNDFLVSLKQQVAKKNFGLLTLAKMAVFGLDRWYKLPLSQPTVLLHTVISQMNTVQPYPQVQQNIPTDLKTR